MTEQKMLPYGYKTFTGVVMSNEQVGHYNYLSQRINKFIESGLPVPESLFYQRRQHFALCAEIKGA